MEKKIIAVINSMTDIPESCYNCKLTEYETGDCSILKQSGQQIRPYNCPLMYCDDVVIELQTKGR